MLLATEFLELRELLAQETRGVPFEVIRNQGRAKARRRTHDHMDVVFIRFHREDLQPLLLAALCEAPLRLFLSLSCQHAPAVLWYPYQMIGDGVVGISRFTDL